MSHVKAVEYATKLTTHAQNLVGVMDRSVRDDRYRDNRFKDAADGLTVAEIRSVAAELDEELERLRNFTDRIHQTQKKLKEVVGV